MAIQRRMFSFDDSNDRDILTYLDSLAASGKASEFVRQAIRQAMADERVTLATILDELRELKRSGIVVQNGNGKIEEPEDIVLNLDKLGMG